MDRMFGIDSPNCVAAIVVVCHSRVAMHAKYNTATVLLSSNENHVLQKDIFHCATSRRFHNSDAARLSKINRPWFEWYSVRGGEVTVRILPGQTFVLMISLRLHPTANWTMMKALVVLIQWKGYASRERAGHPPTRPPSYSDGEETELVGNNIIHCNFSELVTYRIWSLTVRNYHSKFSSNFILTASILLILFKYKMRQVNYSFCIETHGHTSTCLSTVPNNQQETQWIKSPTWRNQSVFILAKLNL